MSSPAPAFPGDVRDVIIVGSGPAGYTAAIYTARANLKPLVIEGAVTAGGALMNTSEVENYPGFTDGILGPDLMAGMRAQAERFGAELLADDVTAVNLTGDIKTVRTETQVFHARVVILATGSQHRHLGVDGEQRLSGRGVSWCATCDGFFFRGKDIIVVGGGDSAMEEATFLSRFAASVTVVHRSATLRASQVMIERAKGDPKIRFELNAQITAVLGDDQVQAVTVLDNPTGDVRRLLIDGVFVAIGHDPRSGLVAGQVTLDEQGYIVVDGRSSRTNLPGVFACGDVVDHTYRQAITASGSGCVAALDAERWLAAA